MEIKAEEEKVKIYRLCQYKVLIIRIPYTNNEHSTLAISGH